MGINFVYFVMSVYGWINWTRKRPNETELPVRFLNAKQNIYAIIATIVWFVVLSFVLTQFTDSTVPYIDSFTTAVFIVGMWLMAVKKVENCAFVFL
jgi:nicotinamide mononucleotide transporter